MLGRAQHVLLVQLVDGDAGVLDHGAAVAVAAVQLAYGGAIGVVEVEHGCQVDVDAAAPELPGHEAAVVACGVGIVELAQVLGAHDGLVAILGLEACHLAALLVEGDEQGLIGQALQVAGEALQLLAAGDVAAAQGGIAGEVDVEEHDGAHVQVAHIACGVALGVDAVALEAHHEHLGGPAAQHRVAGHDKLSWRAHGYSKHECRQQVNAFHKFLVLL